jgi:hypothetical protein
MRSPEVDEFIRANRDLPAPPNGAGPYILVDVAYQDPYIVTATLLIAQSIARLTNQPLVAVTAPALPEETADIVASFRPRSVVKTFQLASRGLIRRWPAVLARTARTRNGDLLESLTVDGIKIGPHLYDTLLMRFGLPSIDAMTPKLLRHLAAELSIFFGMRQLIERDLPAIAILPDNVYRAGMLFELFASRRVPMIAGLDMNGLSAHFYPPDGNYSEHCRAPDRALVDRVVQSPRLLASAEEHLRHRIEGHQAQHDVKRAYASDATMVDRAKLCELLGVPTGKPVVMVAAHVFSDAPHAVEGLLFKDYKTWLLETCRLLRANRDVSFFVKAHPSADLYGEVGTTARLLKEIDAERHLLPVKVNTRALFNCVDAVITCGGTAGSEFPCFGVPVLLAAGAPYDALGYVRRAQTRKEYAEELGRIHTYQKLDDDDVTLARAAMFVMQRLSKIPKEALGLGRQPLLRGVPMDFPAMLREASEDLRSGAATKRMMAAFSALLRGPYRNLVDADLLAAPALEHTDMQVTR